MDHEKVLGENRNLVEKIYSIFYGIWSEIGLELVELINYPRNVN